MAVPGPSGTTITGMTTSGNTLDTASTNRPVDLIGMARDASASQQPFTNDVIVQQDQSKGISEQDLPESIRPKSYSLSSSAATNLTSSTQVECRPEERRVRTLPPWIDSFETSNDDNIRPADRLLASLSRAHSAQHHFGSPHLERRISKDGYVDTYDEVSRKSLAKVPEKGLFNWGDPVKGRKWDHVREGEPVIVQSGFSRNDSPWSAFARSSQYGPSLVEDGERVDQAFLDAQTPGYYRPWRGDVSTTDPEKIRRRNAKRRIWYMRIQRTLLLHPLVPLAFRVVVFTTSVLALGLSTALFHSLHHTQTPHDPSTIMAIVVDVVAIPYIIYITYDEYTGKPLGLRSPKAKIRLVLLDLLFIILESANLSLAFDAIVDPSGCIVYNKASICSIVKTLAAVLLVALIAWMSTFTVSIFRLVERVGGGRDVESNTNS